MPQKTVLIVDDDPRFQAALAAALSSAGYRVLMAADGEEGLRLTTEETPDLVILDLILPKMDGLKVLREMKSREDTKDIPVVVLSNLENSENVELAIRLGAKSYLLKANYSVGGVVEKIRGILGDA